MFSGFLQQYYREKCLNMQSIVYPSLASSFLTLWDMVKYEYSDHDKTTFQKLDSDMKIIKQNLKKRKDEYFEMIISANDEIQKFLLKTGVTAFVNVLDYDTTKPEEEDRVHQF